LAVRNALRYFPTSVHATLAAEFADELRLYGHIYMYRFLPPITIRFVILTVVYTSSWPHCILFVAMVLMGYLEVKLCSCETSISGHSTSGLSPRTFIRTAFLSYIVFFVFLVLSLFFLISVP